MSTSRLLVCMGAHIEMLKKTQGTFFFSDQILFLVLVINCQLLHAFRPQIIHSSNRMSGLRCLQFPALQRLPGPDICSPLIEP